MKLALGKPSWCPQSLISPNPTVMNLHPYILALSLCTAQPIQLSHISIVTEIGKIIEIRDLFFVASYASSP